MCSFLNIHIYLFIWLCWVLVPAQGIFSCSMWTLSWGTWALTRDLTWALELGVQGLNCCTTGGGGGGRVSTCFNYFNVPHSLHSYCDILSLPIQPLLGNLNVSILYVLDPNPWSQALTVNDANPQEDHQCTPVHPLGWMESATQSIILSIIVFFPSALWGLCKLQFSTFVCLFEKFWSLCGFILLLVIFLLGKYFGFTEEL